MVKRRRSTAVLVTGMSGTGKSTALAALAVRGHFVLDTDDPGWVLTSTTSAGAEPLWDLDRVAAALDQHRSGWLFVAGCVANQAAMYEHFDAVALLSAPPEVLLQRVANRANPFGSTVADQRKIIADQAAFEPVLRAGSTHEIDTRSSVADVVAELERIAAAATS